MASIGATIAVLVTVGVAYAGIVGHGHGVEPVQVPVGDGTSRVHVSGHVDGLYPGDTVTLPADVENTTRHDLMVGPLNAIVRPAGPGCPASELSVQPFGGRLSIEPHAATIVALPVTLLSSATDACQDQKFPLIFVAEARRP